MSVVIMIPGWVQCNDLCIAGVLHTTDPAGAVVSSFDLCIVVMGWLQLPCIVFLQSEAEMLIWILSTRWQDGRTVEV